MQNNRRYFISCVSAEFRAYRLDLKGHLTSNRVEVKIQEDFSAGSATLLEKLDDYICNATALLHLIGKSTGASPSPAEVRAIRELSLIHI